MIPLFKMNSTEDDINSVNKVIKRATYWAIGPEIEEFEDALSKYIKTKYAVTFNSGTSALIAMLTAYDIGITDEVIVPSFTFIATANSVLSNKAKAVFADIEDRTYGLDIDSVKEKITPKTKAIMPIHYGGCPALYTRELKELCEEKGLLFFEDAAQSLGSRIYGDRVGSFGDSSIFSFCQDKIISTGEGGVVLTNDENIYNKLKLLRSHGRADNVNYFTNTESSDYISLGYNWRMPTMNAALGLSQLNRIDDLIKKRRMIAERYCHKLHNYVKIPRAPINPYFYHVYQKFAIETIQRDELHDYLLNEEVFTKSYFDLPVHKTTFYRGYEDKLSVTEKISDKILNLPIYPDLGIKDVNYICDCIKDFYENS